MILDSSFFLWVVVIATWMTGLHANGQTTTKPPCPLPEAKPGAGLLDNYLTMMDKKTGVCKKDATQHDSPSPGSLSEYKNHEANTGTAICVLSKSNGTLLSIHNIAFLPNGVDNLYGGLDFKCRHHFRCELLPDFYAHFDAFLVFFRVSAKNFVKKSNQFAANILYCNGYPCQFEFMFFDFFLSFLYISSFVFLHCWSSKAFLNQQTRTFFAKNRPLFPIFFQIQYSLQKFIFLYPVCFLW